MDGTQQGSTAGCSEDDLLGTLLASLECGDSQQPPVVSSASPSVSSSTTSSTFVPGESQAKAAATSSTPPCADLRATATSHNCGADAVAPCAPHNNQQQQQQQQQDTQVQVPQQQQQQRQQGGDEDLSNSIQPIPLKLQGDFQPGELPSLPRLSAPTFGLAPSIEPQMCEGGGRLSGENLISDVLEYIRACSLSVIEYPFSQMKDGSCVLKGGSSTYKFSVLVQPEPGAASPPVEKFENDLIRGGDPVPVNEEGVAVFPRICILSAGRGAVWKLRFYLNYKDQLLLTTDFPVRTFSKQKKIATILMNPNHASVTYTQTATIVSIHAFRKTHIHSHNMAIIHLTATPTFLPATFQPVDQLPSSNPSGFFPVANTPTTTMMAPPSVQQQNQTPLPTISGGDSLDIFSINTAYIEHERTTASHTSQTLHNTHITKLHHKFHVTIIPHCHKPSTDPPLPQYRNSKVIFTLYPLKRLHARICMAPNNKSSRTKLKKCKPLYHLSFPNQK
ncbi:hypothetical protein Pelo_13524 [Pelomyxa schiedti]|nr:hypothetical protein Pelo_13524 [Pelomyxa schiedti]